jgi:hypothetical protein
MTLEAVASLHRVRRPIGLTGWLRGYRVEWRWKEQVIYWRWTTPFTRRGYVFDGGWGAAPPVTYVPTADSWDAIVPPGMVGRRAEILDRIRRSAGEQVIKETDAGYEPGQGHRLLDRRPGRPPP